MTTIQYPPTIVASPGTPANEWAEQTTNVVTTVTSTVHDDGHDHNTSVGSGKIVTSSEEYEYAPETRRIPGSFPGIMTDEDTERLKEGAKEALTTAQQTAQEAYQKAEQAAREYLPVAQQTVNETAQTAYQNVEQAARQYLPTSFIGRLEQVGILGANNVDHNNLPTDTRPTPYTSMPTDEIGPFQPTHGGVGTLPGLPTEEGVAKLPDERIEEMRQELPTREIQTGPTPGGVGSLPGTNSEISVAKLPEERAQEQQATSSQNQGDQLQRLRDELPSKEMNTGPTHGGVGTLPGSRSESGVAILPEERNTETKEPVVKSGVVAGAAVPLTGKVEDTFGRPSDNAHPGKTGVEKQQNFVSLTETSPPKTSTTTDHQRDNDASALFGQAKSGTGDGLHHNAKPTEIGVVDLDKKNPSNVKSNIDSTQDTHGKVSLTTKMKANAKIIGGKIVRDKDLVDEGKSLKSGN
ncbi:hypothetical protein Clacol_000015 [Clathrus columnatus]|uniref:Uncharacterized protein n=1 Tax=Clathrus columnatus TaxID=1419009 RepID=A0AAV4ZYB2_9AGAM|nr:hypothetical protein Clacol_000015 [Clathrus columnatus]